MLVISVDVNRDYSGASKVSVSTYAWPPLIFIVISNISSLLTCDDVVTFAFAKFAVLLGYRWRPIVISYCFSFSLD